MSARELIALLLLGAGAFFFLAGTIALLRFPDVHARLHGLTKVDNVGLGLLVAGLALRSGSLAVAAKLVLIWLLVLVASAATSQLIAHHARSPEEPQ